MLKTVFSILALFAVAFPLSSFATEATTEAASETFVINCEPAAQGNKGGATGTLTVTEENGTSIARGILSLSFQRAGSNTVTTSSPMTVEGVYSAVPGSVGSDGQPTVLRVIKIMNVTTDIQMINLSLDLAHQSWVRLVDSSVYRMNCAHR